MENKLDNLKLSDFTNAKLIRILDALTEENLLGQGAVGKVYLVNEKYVVKEISPCDAPEDSALRTYCDDILNIKNKIPTIPGGNGKIRYLLPNLMSETLIGIILGQMKETLAFSKTLGSIIEKEEDYVRIYIVMKAYNSLIENRFLNPLLEMTNPKSFLIFLFQIAHGIYSAQQKYRFTHYDLHTENILWAYWASPKDYLSYHLPNFESRILLSADDSPFIFKITDFGLGRMETKNVLITPTVDTFPQKTYGEFSPSYDILSILGAICIDNKYRVAFDNLLWNNLDLYKFLLMFILWVLNDKEIVIGENSLENLIRVRDLIGNKYYLKLGTIDNKFSFRPENEGQFIAYTNTKSMISIVNFLGRVLIATKVVTVSNRSDSDVLRLKSIENLKKYDKVLLFAPEIEITGTPRRGRSLSDFKETGIDDLIKVRSYRVLTNAPPKKYNFTVSEKQLLNCPIQEHYMTAVFVNRNALLNYRFGFDCCKIDAPNYLLENKKIGFVINGGFFNIKKDFLPIGPYQDKYNKIDKYPIPEKYRDVFGYVVLQNNSLRISRKRETGRVLTTGPMLIEDGNIVFNPDETRFDCDEEKNAGNNMISLGENDITLAGYFKYRSVDGGCSKEFVPDVKTYPRCDKIGPGELSHADNPNPRSALCILRDGSYIFLTAEGRGKRGVGLDLYTLSTSIKRSFPQVKTAINLDGGRSSNLAWRSKYEPNKVYISNTDRNYFYPVGNILTLFRN